MAQQRGYDQDRFNSPVPHGLLCNICKDVLRNPKSCKNGGHLFCHYCIHQWLTRVKKCPQCKKHLTPETLVHPQQCFLRILNDLEIKCDYHERGCYRPIPLGNLEVHVSRCGFAPVKCEECGMQINKKDKDDHNTSFCPLAAIPTCQDCGEIKETQDEMKETLELVIQKHNDAVEQQREILDGQEQYLLLGRTIIAHQQTLKRKQDQMEESQVEMKEIMKRIEKNQNEQKDDVREIKHLLTKKSNQATDEPVTEFLSSTKEIIIMGGKYDDRTLESVSIFKPNDGTYAELPPMDIPRHSASSCVYNNDVIITGGCHGEDGVDTIEILKINQRHRRRRKLSGKLPFKVSSHVTIVIQGKSLVVGGYNWDTNEVSKEIHEVSLAQPYPSKLLTTLPQPRHGHAAEIVNDKLFILGGLATSRDNDPHDSVMMYDFTTKTFKTCPPLPKPVCHMATVTWGNKIIIVGGKDTNGEVLNDVIIYHTESGLSERLPSLKHKRCGSSAVIIDDVIVVFGGWNVEQENLNSVESFTMGSDGWKELPGMKEKRSYATVVVKP